MHVFFLRFIGVVFAGYGAYLCVDPHYLFELLEMTESTPGLVEVRAMYGGLQLGVGLLLLWGAQRSPAQQQVVFAVVIACFGGLATARGVGLLLEGSDTYNLSAFIFETASLLIAVYLCSNLASKSDSASA